MLAYVALALVVLALWRCPFWGAGKRVFLPLYLWALYCAVAPINLFGVTPLEYRWPLAIASGAVGLLWWTTGRDRSIDTVGRCCMLVIALALVSTAWSRLPDYTMGRALALLPIFFFAIVGARSLLFRPGGLEAVSICVLLAQAIPAALAFSSSVEQNVYIETEYGSSSYRFQGHMKATGTGHVIVGLFPFLIWYMRHGRTTHKLFNYGAFGYLTFLLLATRTRTSLVSALLVIPTAWAAIRSKKKVGGATTLTLVFMAAVAFGLQFLPEELLSGYARTSSTQDLVKTRMEGRWDLIWDQAMDSPVLGHGLGMVRFYNSPMATFDFATADESRRTLQKNTHNEYLSLFYDLGFVPPLLFLGFVIATATAGLRWLGTPSSRKRDFLVAVFLSTSVDLINTVSHDGLMTVGNPSATIFWIKCMMLLTLKPDPRP